MQPTTQPYIGQVYRKSSAGGGYDVLETSSGREVGTAANAPENLIIGGPKYSGPDMTKYLTTQPKTPTSSVVQSNANIIENVIPKNKNTLNELSNKGTYVDAQGIQRYSDGSLVPPPPEATAGENGNYSSGGFNYAAPLEDTSFYDRQEEALLERMRSSLDSQTKALIDNIQQKYEIRRQQLKDVNTRQEKGINQTLLLSESSRYAPLSSEGIMSTQERHGIQELADLDAEENDLILKAKAAQADGDFRIMQETLNRAERKRQEKVAKASKLNEAIAEENKKSREKAIQSTRDDAVASLYAQGITDTVGLLDKLNYNEDGVKVADFTAEEVQKTLTNIAKNAGIKDLDKLSSDVRDFFVLQQNGVLPENISGLPEKQQLGAWLKYMKPVKTPGAGSVNKITMGEARSQGLPLSVVGMSENEIAASFTDPNPPQWFVEKAQGEAQKSLMPEIVQSLWNDYRSEYEKNRGKAEPASTADKAEANVKDRATKYFSSAYGSAIDASTMQQLVDRVALYTNGGYSYDKAVEKVIEEASE